MGIRSVYHKSIFVFLTLCIIGACSPPQQTLPTIDQSASTLTQPSELALPKFSQKCLTVLPTIPQDFELSGKLIVKSSMENHFIVSLPDFEKEILPKSFLPVLMSPNHKLFAFLEAVDFFVYSRLIVANSRGQQVASFDWNPDWEFPVQWVNNDSLLIRTSDVNSLVLLNIVSGEKQEILFPYGDSLYIEDGVAKIRSGFLAYDSTMTKAIYEADGHVFILRDLDVLPDAVLWAKRNNINWADPVWSPSADRVAVPLMDEQGIDNLYVVGAFGDSESRLTNFDDIYNHPASTTIYDISWSPNGIDLAIQLDLRMNEQDPPQKIGTRLAGRLLVVNSITQQITDYCLVYAFPPVWSPDKKYLSVDNYIVDLSQQTAYKVTDGYIIGWLADE